MDKPMPDADKDAAIDPLALALFGVRDHIRHHFGCLEKRGLAGLHYDESDECALRDIIKRYGDDRALLAQTATESGSRLTSVLPPGGGRA